MTPLGCPDCLLIRYELCSSTERFTPSSPTPESVLLLHRFRPVFFSLFSPPRTISLPLSGDKAGVSLAASSHFLRERSFSLRAARATCSLPPFLYRSLLSCAPDDPHSTSHRRRRLFLPLLFLKCTSFLLLNLHTLSLRF